MSAAMLTTMTMFEVLVNCFFHIVPMRWSHLSMAHPEKKGAKPDQRTATKSKSNIRRPIVFRPELLELFKVSAPTIWLWQVKLGFPKSIVCGGRSAWYADEVEQWIASRPRRKIKKDTATPEGAEDA